MVPTGHGARECGTVQNPGRSRQTQGSSEKLGMGTGKEKKKRACSSLMTVCTKS